MTNYQTNPNHTLYYGKEYNGLPIMHEKGPFIRGYLDQLYTVMTNAMTQYREVFAFRVDLRLPENYIRQEPAYPNELIDRFIESFKAKIRHNRQMAFRENRYAHDSIVRYAWAREVGGRYERPHYHVVIFLNKDAYCTLGTYEIGRDNMFNRLHEAWASALSLPLDAVKGAVHIPDNPCYALRYDDYSSIANFFYRASYLCKAATKTFGHGGHGFGASRM